MLLGLAVSAFALALGVLLLEVVARGMSAPRPTEPRPIFAGHEPRNSLGFRDFEYPEAKAEGHFRILAIGDSFTAAEAVSFDDSFAKRLERALNHRSLDGTVYEVLNLGVSRRSTPEEVDLAKRMIPRFSADLVVLAYCLNDSEDWTDPNGVQALRGRHAFERFREPKGFAGFLYRHSALARIVARRLYNARTHRGHGRYYRALYRPGYSGWKKTREALAELGELSRSSGVPVVLMVFPLYSWGLDESYPFRAIHGRLRKAAQETGLRHLDLFPAHGGYEPVRVEALPGIDAHPNEIGHRIAAEALWKFLVTERLLPSAQPGRVREPIPFAAPPSPARVSSDATAEGGRSTVPPGRSSAAM